MYGYGRPKTDVLAFGSGTGGTDVELTDVDAVLAGGVDGPGHKTAERRSTVGHGSLFWTRPDPTRGAIHERWSHVRYDIGSMQHLALRVRSTPYLPFVFVRGDVKNDVIVYLQKLQFLMTVRCV